MPYVKWARVWILREGVVRRQGGHAPAAPLSLSFWRQKRFQC